MICGQRAVKEYRKFLRLRNEILDFTNGIKGFDLFASPRFAEWLACRFCGLRQTPPNAEADGLHLETGSRVEIKFSRVTTRQRVGNQRHSFDAFHFAALHGRSGKDVSAYVLVGGDLEGAYGEVLRFFVIPAEELPNGPCIDVRVEPYQINRSETWQDYEVSIRELAERVLHLCTDK